MHAHKRIIFYIYIIKTCTDKLSELMCFRGFPQPGCKVALFLSNYCILANYSWLLVEGHYLHSLINLSLRSQKKRVHWYILLGWGRFHSPESIMDNAHRVMLIVHVIFCTLKDKSSFVGMSGSIKNLKHLLNLFIAQKVL